MNPFSWFFEFAASDKIKFTHKGTVTIIVFTAVLLLDGYLGFSYNYKVKAKLDQIQTVTGMLQNPTIDSSSKAYLLELQYDIIRRKSALDYFLGGRASLASKMAAANNASNNALNIEPVFYEFFYFLSKWILFIGIGLIFFFITVFDKHSKASIGDKFGAALFYLFFFLFAGYIVSKLLDLIPFLWGRPHLNILLNFIVTAIIIEIGMRFYFKVRSIERVNKDADIDEKIDALNKRLTSIQIEQEILKAKKAKKKTKISN